MMQAFSAARPRMLVDAPEPDQRWLAAFLRPALAASAPLAADAEATVVVLERVDRLLPQHGTARQTVFAMDSGPVRLPFTEGAGARLFDDPALRVQYRTCGRRGVVNFEQRQHGGARIALMRVLREHDHNRAVSDGSVMLHAAALGTPTGAIAIAGVKGAGKTTLLLRLLASGEGTYLSNDRLEVDPRSCRARAVPTIVGVRRGTRDLLPGLGATLGRLGDFRSDEGDSTAPAAGPATRDGVWHFSPRQLTTALGCGMTGEAPLAAVIVVTGTGGERTTATPLREAEAAAILAGSVIGHRVGCYASEVFSPPASPIDDGIIEARCAQICRRVPVFSVHAGAVLCRSEAASLVRQCVA